MDGWKDVDLAGLVLHSDRLTLRALEPADAPWVLRAASTDAAMKEFLPIPDPYTATDAEDYVADFGHEGRYEGTGFGSAIVEIGSGSVVGSIALRFPAGRHSVAASIGYAIYPWGRGHGYAAESSDLLARWAFEHGLDRVELVASVRNIASIKTALRAGFRFEGIHRRDISAREPDLLGFAADDAARFARLATDSGDPVPATFTPLPAEGLSDGIVTLRPATVADLDGLFEEVTDPLSMSWELDDDPVERATIFTRLNAAGLHWLVGPIARMTIVDQASGAYAGSMQLRRGGPPQMVEIGYAVHPAFRGRGYTTRGLRLLTDWAFSQTDLVRLELGAKVANVASQKAALNAGFVADGVSVARLRNPDGTFSDEARFALVSPTVR